jgi:hypothetical protein
MKRQLAALDLSGHVAEAFFVEGTLPPLQRNVAIRQSTGRFVFLLDDDLVIPPDLVSKTLPHFDDDRVAAVGGPNLTPADDPPFAQLSGEILASRLATGGTSDRWRTGAADADATESKLHGCFLCFRGDLLRRNLFVETLFPNDENELMWRLRRDGFRLLYLPQCAVWHRRRGNLRAHLKQVYVSGRGRGELVRRVGPGRQWAYFVPLAFLVYLPVAAVAGGRAPILFAPLAIYGVLAAAESVRTWARRRRSIFLWAGPLMFASHLIYAVGLARGLAADKQHVPGAAVVEVVRLGESADRV